MRRSRPVLFRLVFDHAHKLEVGGDLHELVDLDGVDVHLGRDSCEEALLVLRLVEEAPVTKDFAPLFNLCRVGDLHGASYPRHAPLGGSERRNAKVVVEKLRMDLDRPGAEDVEGRRRASLATNDAPVLELAFL